MKIGIDARLVPYKRRGWGQYTFNLIKALVKLDNINEYILFYNFLRKGKKDLVIGLNQHNARERIYRFPDRILDFCWNILHFPPIEIFIGKVDIFHSPFDYIPPQWHGKSAATVHDLTYLKFPELHDKGYVSKRRNALEYVAEKASVIITDAHTVKDDLIKMIGIPENKIRVIPAAADERFKPIDDKNVIKYCLEKYGITKNYILFVGAADPDKNLSRLLGAFSLLKKNSHIAHNLVCVGNIAWGYNKILREAVKLELQEEVIFTGFIPDEDMVLLYNGADLLVLPSLDEGFGLPLVEAMACGTPVAASNAGAIPEVVGDAGILFDPYNKEEIAQAILRVLESEALKKELRDKAIHRAGCFSWDDTAKKTLAIYREVGGV